MTIPVARRLLASGMNHYVAALAYDAAFMHGAPAPVSLGTPAVADDDIIHTGINAQATAGTEVAISYTMDSPYGRTVQAKVSGDPGAASSVFDLYGLDWLGQPMIERFTTANGSTAINWGKKAFYKITKTRIITASTNAVTIKIGTALRLGLPFKSDIVWAREAGVLVPLYNRDWITWRDIAAAAVGGGPSGAWVYAEFPGFVKSVIGVANMPVGSTNDPAITVELATVAIVGLTVTIDTSAAATGALVSDVPTTVGYSANNRFVKGDLIEIVASDADTSGAISVGLELTPTQYSQADVTDPATRTTGDPRGTYEPIVTMAGHEITVGLMANPDVNAAGNGGLHGIQHFAA